MSKARKRVERYISHCQLLIDRSSPPIRTQGLKRDLEKILVDMDDDLLVEFSGDELYPEIKLRPEDAKLYCCYATTNPDEATPVCNQYPEWIIHDPKEYEIHTHSCSTHLAYLLNTFSNIENGVGIRALTEKAVMTGVYFV